MRILVTGCAGFIGWKVCEFLLHDGHAIVGIDNLDDTYDVRIKHWRLAQLSGHPGFSFTKLDISGRDDVTTVGAKGSIDAVVNLAARDGARESVSNPWIFSATNTAGTLNLLEFCREHRVRKFILASTSSLYAGNPMPFREDANTDRPMSPYAASKKAAEELCHAYHYLHGLDVTVVRYFTVYGPAGRPDMSLFGFVQRISEGRTITVHGDGTQRWDFVFLDDVARGTIAGLKPLGYEIINLGSDEPVSVREAVGLLEDLIGARARIEYTARHAADMTATWADISKAERLLGWHPTEHFSDGLIRLVSWYRENRSWAKDIVTEYAI